jgi:hypothetical protein
MVGELCSMPARICTSPRDAVLGLLNHIKTILATVARPDYREDDPRPGRERFYRQNALQPGRWMRVVLDFNNEPGWVVTVLVQDDDPRPRIS